jgi:predicted NAD/FAD-binding protein
MESESPLNIAVVGAGAAGIVSAYILQRKHSVTLFEKNDYFGGHTHTVVTEDGPDVGTPVDTGFIVCNDRTYPLFQSFLSQLDVSLEPSDMSFSYTDHQTGLAYASRNLNVLFSQRRNLVRPSFLGLLFEIKRFNKKTLKNLDAGLMRDHTLGEYLEKEGFSARFVEQYITPMGAAIWSTPDRKMMDFPAESFARFFQNHGLLSFSDQPQWYFVSGGSNSYVKAFLNNFKGKAIKNNGIEAVERTKSGVVLSRADGIKENFDRVVIATHADEAYALLADPSRDETRLLSPWEYSENHTVLHTDVSRMPTNRRVWASWNYVREEDKESPVPVAVTYHMNRLQSLTTVNQYCVTLNPANPIPQEHIIREMRYRHPLYNFEALDTQTDLPGLNGFNNTYFCGSYFGYGFHEDAVRSAVQVGSAFGVTL